MLESGVRLTTVECAYGERDYELGDHSQIRRVRVRANSLVWNKENLLNLGIQRLPEDWKYVCTADADIKFRHASWAAHSVDALQHYRVIQPWEHCYDLGPQGQHLDCHTSLLSLWSHDKPIVQGPGQSCTNGYKFGHPGFAWCWTRQALEWVGGLLESACLGAADHHMALGLFGKAAWSYPSYISEGYKRDVAQWEARACQHIGFRVGHLGGTIEHMWHGRKADRKYVDRWEIIRRHGFDPATDLKRNTHGVVELTGNKPLLAHDIDRYFRQRSEDANSIE